MFAPRNFSLATTQAWTEANRPGWRMQRFGRRPGQHRRHLGGFRIRWSPGFRAELERNLYSRSAIHTRFFERTGRP